MYHPRVKLLVLTFLLFVAIKANNCPQLKIDGKDTWKITLTRAAIYFENESDKNGFYMMPVNNLELSNYVPYVRFYGPGKIFLNPPPPSMGFNLSNQFSIDGNYLKITETLPSYREVLGQPRDTYVTTFDSTKVCAGFGHTNTTEYFGMCPYDDWFSDPTTCLSYICYPSYCACNCTTCSQTDQTNCTSCNSGYFLQIESKRCLDDCTIGYKNYTDNTCYSCDSACSSCSGPSNQECSVCAPGYYLQPQPLTTCLRSCPPGSVADSDSGSCLACGTDCLTCSLKDKTCAACKPDYFLQPNLIDCTSVCGSGYYENYTNNTCLSCSQSCSICANPSNCSQCFSGYYLTNFSNDANACEKCHTACETCFDDLASTCISCSFGYFLQPSPNQYSCNSSCPSGYYADSSRNKCIPCDKACSTCTGETQNNCTECNAGFYLQPLAPTTCINSCPSGYTTDISINQCTPCDLNCKECSQSVSNCTSCDSGKYLYQNECVTICPDGYYENSTTNICEKCDQSCSICRGASQDQCTECSYGYFSVPDQSTCVKSCPSGYWLNVSILTCSPCCKGCSKCKDSDCNSCIACQPSYFLQQLPPLSAICMESCPNGYWPDFSSNICSPCHPACSSCTGPKGTDCASCSLGYFLQPNSSTCLTSCPPGYYNDYANNQCLPCPTSCTTCWGPTECSACVRGYYYEKLSKKCFETCPQGYWVNSENSLCSACDPTCLTCTSGGDRNCTSCKTGFYLNSSSSSCQKYCPSGYYMNPSSNTCDPCNQACTSCYGPTQSECSSCSTGFSLITSLNTCCADQIEISTSSLEDACAQAGKTKKVNSWSLTVLGLYILWVMITIMIIQTTKAKEICLIESFKKKLNSGQIKPQKSYILVISCLITHPLLSVYLFKGSNSVSKVQRTWIYFVRSLTILILSSPFVDTKNKVTQIIKTKSTYAITFI